jgi:CRISPR-associated protein Cmr1
MLPLFGKREQRRGLTAALWLLGHLGGLGSRSRRGFGALALTEWGPVGSDGWPESETLPLLSGRQRTEDWRRGLLEGLATLRVWLGSDWSGARHPHLGPAARLALGSETVHGRDGWPANAWDQALADMGQVMQAYRRRYRPDYDMVKAQLTGQANLTRAPHRASFGLPLAFHFSSIHDARNNLEVQGYDSERKRPLERHGSLLHLRPVLAGGRRLLPLWLRLDGDVPGFAPGAAVRRGPPLGPPEVNAMDALLDEQLGATTLQRLLGAGED